jgi:hypothetical protein
VKGEWAYVVEFCNIDFLAVNCWLSKGYAVHGHEIKVSRADWQRELRKPGKAAMGMARCDYWWVVAPEKVIKPEEVPERWGFLELQENRFAKVIQAPRLRGAPPKSRLHPTTVERESFAMMARRFSYANADFRVLLDAVDQPEPYLDAAALATGRATASMRMQNAEARARQRELAKRWKSTR